MDIDDQTVQAIYNAAAGLLPWSAPLGTIFRALNARCMQLVFIEHRTGKLLASEQPIELFDSEAVTGTLEHIREWAQVDPHIAEVAKLPLGHVYDSERAGAPSRYANHPFYTDHWGAYQNRGLLGAKVAEEAERATLWGVIRSWWHPAFTLEEASLFGRYVGHLSAALRINKYVQRLRTDAIAGRTLMDGAPNPMLLLSRDQRIMAINEAARRLLASRDVLIEEGGHLTCGDAGRRKVLSNAFARLDANTTDDAATKARLAIRFDVRGGKPLLCSLWSMRPEKTMGAFGNVPSVLFSVADTAGSDSVDPTFLGSLFDLTAAEARVAIALRPGATLSAIAAERHVSVETIRSQVRAIYAKTGTRNRAEVLRLLQSLTRP